MTAYLELMLLVAFVGVVTGLLVTGAVDLAFRLAAPRSERRVNAKPEQNSERKKWEA